MMLKVLLTGAGGLLGQTLQAQRPDDVMLQALTRQQLDITQAQAVNDAVQAFKPHIIINAAAYTQVDKAEQEPEQAYAVNRDGVVYLAQAAADLDIPLLHISTDYVFDGVFKEGVCRPYTKADEPHPLNVYGASKLAGERALQGVCEKSIIIRTSSLFSSQLSPNGNDFVAWVLRQALQEKSFCVVDSWVSCPTSVEALAVVLWGMEQKAAQGDASTYGLWHYAEARAMSRYMWAKEIVAAARQTGLLRHDVEVLPCAAQGVKTTAQRPVYSALSCKRLEKMLESFLLF